MIFHCEWYIAKNLNLINSFLFGKHKFFFIKVWILSVEMVVFGLTKIIEPSFIDLAIRQHFFTIAIMKIIFPPPNIIIPITANKPTPSVHIVLLHLSFINWSAFINGPNYAIWLILLMLAHVYSTTKLERSIADFAAADLDKSQCNNLLNIQGTKLLPSGQGLITCVVDFGANLDLLINTKDIVEVIVPLQNLLLFLQPLNLRLFLSDFLFIFLFYFFLLFPQIFSLLAQSLIFQLQLLFKFLLVLNLFIFLLYFINVFLKLLVMDVLFIFLFLLIFLILFFFIFSHFNMFILIRLAIWHLSFI